MLHYLIDNVCMEEATPQLGFAMGVKAFTTLMDG